MTDKERRKTQATTAASLDQPGDPERANQIPSNLDREALDLETAGRSAPRGARAFLWLTILIALAVAAGVLMKAWSRETEEKTDTGLEADQSGITNRLKAPRVERP